MGRDVVYYRDNEERSGKVKTTAVQIELKPEGLHHGLDPSKFVRIGFKPEGRNDFQWAIYPKDVVSQWLDKWLKGEKK